MKEVEFCESVLVFNNGQEAIDGLTEISENGGILPTVIFLDLNMPIMNGWEFLDRFTKIPNRNFEDITVYIISSSIDPRDLEKVKKYEVVNNYIAKPVSSKDLASIMDAINNH